MRQRDPPHIYRKDTRPGGHLPISGGLSIPKDIPPVDLPAISSGYPFRTSIRPVGIRLSAERGVEPIGYSAYWISRH